MSMQTHYYLTLVIACVLYGAPPCAEAWDSSEMEIFDLVEELGTTTFYELLAVAKDATSAEIRRAYRKQSLVFHPDKNKEEDAGEKFRQIAAVADVLRDAEKRAVYDRVLVEGLPNWQQPAFYFRKVRRMGTLEVLLAVFIISTVVHYGYLCAAFLEQYYQAEVATAKRKRKGKKSKDAADDTDEPVYSVKFPGPLSILPVVLARSSVVLLLSLPTRWQQWQEERQRQREETERLHREAEEKRQAAEEEAARAVEMRQRRVQYKLKQKQDLLQDQGNDDDVDWGRVPNAAEATTTEGVACSDDGAAMTAGKRPWSEEEITALTRAVVRFPGGTLKRWERIATEVGRTVDEVTTQVKQLKHRVAKAAVPVNGTGAGTGSSSVGKLESSKRAAASSSRLCTDITVRTGNTDTDTSPKASSGASSAASGTAVASASTFWSQDEQRLLERALAKHGRDVSDRWERIAAEIPGKTKADCVARFKHIAMQVRQRKTTVPADPS